MPRKEIFHIIQKKLSGTCSPQEDNQLKNWLSADVKHQKYFNSIEKIWNITPGQDVDVNFEEEWRRINSCLDIEVKGMSKSKKGISKVISTSKNNSIRHIIRIAAVILLVALPIVYFTGFGSKPAASSSTSKITMQKVETAAGERSSMEFSDGSKITLNSMSTVRFPKVFKGGEREIYLEGEAFFKVAHNAQVPFIVHSNGVEIKVLGTEFNINGYKENNQVEVVVREGKVAVKQNHINKNSDSNSPSSLKENERHASEVVLRKGQRTLVKAGEVPSTPQNVLLKPYLAWVNGYMVFEGLPMREVIPRLERAYNLNFEVQDSTLLSQRLEASFKRERTEKVLGIIAFSLGIAYELHGDTVIFKSNS